MPDKLTDSEIVKAWEDEIHLAEYVDSGFCNGVSLSLVKSTLALINRLQAENENLRDSLVKKRFKDEMFEMTLKEYTDGKIKEFAERLKEKAYTYSDITGYQSTVVDVNEIDGVYEELVGE